MRKRFSILRAQHPRLLWEQEAAAENLVYGLSSVNRSDLLRFRMLLASLSMRSV
jgi:hypothetical protein